jgi:uncharacterized integral membrane protein (TIGR00698 family)
MQRLAWVRGAALACALALPAVWVGALVPAVGPPVMAIASGALAAGLLRRRWPRVLDACAPGLAVAARTVLQLAIVAMGFGFPIGAAVGVGSRSVPTLVGTLAVAGLGILVLGRMLALHRESALLVGVGTAICGASAIAAVTAVVRPATHRVGYAITTIFVFNIIAVLAYPPLGRLLGLSPEAFGVWAGTAINDTSSVLAAATAFGAVAVHYAVVVKLVRSLAIVPLCIGLQIGRRQTAADTPPAWRVFPWFVVAFVGASMLASVLPFAVQTRLSGLSRLLITVALASVGTTVTADRLRLAGARPMVFGGLLATLVAASSLAIQAVTTGW